MRKPTPQVLWIAIAALGVAACAHLGLAVKNSSNSLFMSALIEALVIVGLIHGQKWAYVLTVHASSWD